MSGLTTQNLGLTKGGASLVRGANLSLQSGELVALLGPNGAGKTSLLRAALGLEKPRTGEARLGGDVTMDLSAQDRARRVAYLPQARPLAWPNRAADIVALGRYAYGAQMGALRDADAAAVEAAMAACDIAHLSNRAADTLSGGELARVHLARAFAAEAPLLVADEPVAALDPRHQFRVMELIADYVSRGNGALVVLHDIGLAAQYATRLIWMREGEIVADGPPRETLTEARLAEVYRIKAKVNGTSVTVTGAL